VFDQERFDGLAKDLANGTVSRGKALRLLGGALVGAALASVPGVAWAASRCPTGKKRCEDRCVNLRTNESHCGSCRNRCRSAKTCCGGRCVNLQRSERHCGSCGNRCAAGQECVNGRCQGGGGCPSGTQKCGTQCCQTGETCVGGTTCCPNAQVCGTGTSATCCQTGETCVGGACCPNARVCGTGTSATCCQTGETCVNGMCQSSGCPSGTTQCGYGDWVTCCGADGSQCVNGRCRGKVICPGSRPELCGPGPPPANAPAACCAAGQACDCDNTTGCVCRHRTTCTPQDPVGACGNCKHPINGNTVTCDCRLLPSGNAFCYWLDRCSRCADCPAGTVCITHPQSCPHTGGTSCLFPCNNGGTCPSPFP
jgi:hypothetical protein